MIIKRESANGLCKLILEEIVAWTAIDAALRTGGLEVKARGRYEIALAKWLRQYHRARELVVLPEYTRSPEKGRGKTIDFSVIEKILPTTPHSAFVVVKALFEVKFNYASQSGQEKAQGGEFRWRLTEGRRDAIKQALDYMDNVEAQSAFVIYLVADPKTDEPLPKGVRDSGWKYFDDSVRRSNRNRGAIGIAEAKKAILCSLSSRQLRICGEHSIATQTKKNPRACAFYCCLIEATVTKRRRRRVGQR